jgi:type I restriction enzyme S subunit
VLYGKLRPYLDKAVVAETEGICSTDILVLEPIEVSSWFLCGVLHSNAFLDHAKQTTHGVNHPRTSWSGIEAFEILSLGLLERRKISAVLLKIQRAIETQDKIIQLLRDLKKSIMQHLFTHGLHGEKTKMTEIGEMPESWETCPIGVFAEVVMGQSPKSHHYNKDGTGLPLLNGPAEFTNRHPIPVQWTTSPTRIAKKGDILFCVRGNTVARMNIADQDYCVGRGLAAIRGIAKTSTTDFLYFVIHYHAERIYTFATAGGSTFPNFSRTDFDALAVQKPSVDEQTRIANILGILDHKTTLHESKKSALQDLFKTTLNKLMTGDIRVADLDIDVKEVAYAEQT